MAEYVQVQTSVPSQDEGLRIAQSLVDAHLAACAQVVGPMLSTYRWKGETQVDQEYLLLVKTPAGRYPEVEARIHALHSYEVAEIISVPINAGLASYLAWMDEETAAPGG